MHSGHFKVVCGCGVVIDQCRCPSPDKEVRKGVCEKCKTQKKTKKPKTGVSYDEVQAQAEKLVALLKDRETGLFSWHTCVNEQMKSLHDLICPLCKSK